MGTTEGKDCTGDATLLPLECILRSKLASCAWLSASNASSNNCSFCNSDDFTNISNLPWILCLLYSANNSLNSDVLRLSSEKHEVCEGGDLCGMDSNLEPLLEDDLLQDFELL